MIKEIVKGVWAFCSYLFVPQCGKHPKDTVTTEMRKETNNCRMSNMIEIKIEKLPKEFIDYVKQNTGVVKSYVNDKPLYYSRGGCHVNSVLLCDDISSSNKYPVAIIEGLMVCSDGMAYLS